MKLLSTPASSQFDVEILTRHMVFAAFVEMTFYGY